MSGPVDCRNYGIPVSAPVDVLAVMDWAEKVAANRVAMLARRPGATLGETGDTLEQGAARVRELSLARAAVAELVAAATAIKAKRGGTMGLGATDARTARLLAALSKFGGAA